MPVLLLWNRIDFSSDENDAPPIRVVAMNCSIVYCFTAPASAAFFFGSGVCFVISDLFDTSGFDSGDGLWADASEIKIGRANRQTNLVRCMAVRYLPDLARKQKTYCLPDNSSTLMADLCPGFPLKPPPPWALEPQRKTFSNSVS